LEKIRLFNAQSVIWFLVTNSQLCSSLLALPSSPKGNVSTPLVNFIKNKVTKSAIKAGPSNFTFFNLQFFIFYFFWTWEKNMGTRKTSKIEKYKLIMQERRQKGNFYVVSLSSEQNVITLRQLFVPRKLFMLV